MMLEAVVDHGDGAPDDRSLPDGQGACIRALNDFYFPSLLREVASPPPVGAGDRLGRWWNQFRGDGLIIPRRPLHWLFDCARGRSCTLASMAILVNPNLSDEPLQPAPWWSPRFDPGGELPLGEASPAG